MHNSPQTTLAGFVWFPTLFDLYHIDRETLLNHAILASGVRRFFKTEMAAIIITGLNDIFVELFEDSDFSDERDLKGDDGNVDIDHVV